MVELDETLAASEVMATLAASLSNVVKGTLVERPRSTIEPRDEMPASVSPASLPSSEGVPGFVVRRTLGEGGMGIVRAAEQLSVGRLVAVKTVRSEIADDPRVATRLLREAWLAGRVEHPNVVPIYDVGVDDVGRPHIAMRLVEGTPWDELVRDPELVRSRFKTTDVLEWHLRVLVQVTHAVSRAHAKGIVHRDIKPENVMIGEFGEVYLLDWGIAVSLVADPEGRLPLARDAKETAGTPCYMAPEMLGGPKPLIDERTDVYLLGATLYEIVTGKPPHTGKVFAEMVRSILESSPSFPPEVPRGLVAICEKAMQRRRHDRYTSAQEVRAALSDFLTHRGSSALAEEANARKAEMIASLGGSPDKLDRHALYEAFGAARFGYLEALKLWPLNDDAREGLQNVCERMVAFELLHGSAEAAQAALAVMPSPPVELTARVEAALRARAEEKRRLATFEREYDPRVGRRTRLVVGTAVCLMGIFGPLVLSARPEVAWVFGTKVVAAVTCAGVFARERVSLGRTKLNRDLSRVVLAGFVIQALLVPATALLGMSRTESDAAALFVWAQLHFALALTTDWRLGVTALAFATGSFVAARWPQLSSVAQSLSSVCAVLVVVWAWRTADSVERTEATSRDASPDG